MSINRKTDVPSVLTELFDVKQQSGWIALLSWDNRLTKGFGTRRIAKLMTNDQLFFTIGGTTRGVASKLNQTIRSIIRLEAIEVIEGRSTAGPKKEGPLGSYPGFEITGVGNASITRVVHRIEGALLSLRE
jgi:hypothetical protein